MVSVCPIRIKERPTNHDIWSDLGENHSVFVISIVPGSAAVVLEIIGIGTRNAAILVAGCFLACVPSCARTCWRWFRGRKVLDLLLLISIVSCSLSMWLVLGLYYSQVLDDLGSLQVCNY
jgi:hypothetical protein